MKETVVLYPFPAMGHLVPMVELAKLFILDDFSVAIVLMDTLMKPPSAASLIDRVSSTHPSISFHYLSALSLSTDLAASPTTDVLFEQIRLNNASLHDFLASHYDVSSIRAIILDFFCTDALDVAAELGIPSYFFYASGAYDLAAFLYMPTMFSATDSSFKELGDSPLDFPGLPPIPASHLPEHMKERDTATCKRLLSIFGRLPNADGILINSFVELESRAVRAIRDGACVPGSRTPPVFCIGPVIADGRSGLEGKEEKHECITWLDSQPHGSVVFLCFGSMGSFTADQIKEIATGLENSGQRFLWVVRATRTEDQTKIFDTLPEPDLEELLPVGFQERIKERGMVVKSWAPQTAVLSHDAVSGFVTHCGWNSTLESIVYGVAMIAWPLYAEQRMNMIFVVEEMKLGVAMEGYDKEKVAAEEVETKVRWLMESEGGRELKERAAAAKERAAEARREGGSSYRAWLDFVRTLRS